MYELDKYTVSLLHFDDGFKDETGKVWTAHGKPTISAAKSKFGGKSLCLDGSSYLSTPANDGFKLGTGDFTVDWWEYRTGAATKSQIAVSCAISSTANMSFIFGNTNSDIFGDNITWYMSSNGTAWDISGARTMGTAVYNEWVHYAITRKDGTFYVFQNGILKDSLYSPLPMFNSVADWLIGSFASPLQVLQGYIDELRISNIARWTENFDPIHTEDGKYLLTITLAEEVEREYPVTKNELDAFIKWYDSRSNGTGSVYYTFDKFLNRKDYIVYDKILTFEVTDFSK